MENDDEGTDEGRTSVSRRLNEPSTRKPQHAFRGPHCRQTQKEATGRPMDQTEYWQVTCRPLLTLRFRWWPRFGLVRALGRDLGDTNSSGAYGRAASNGRPEQLPSFSAVTAPMETNPRALSCHFAMVDPLVVLGPPGLGLGVRIWQPDVSGRRDGLPVYAQFLLLRTACEMTPTNRRPRQRQRRARTIAITSILPGILCHA